MAVKSLTNLLVATGLSAASSSMSFRNSMIGHPLPDGRSMQNYVLSGLTSNSQSFNVSTPIRNYSTISWRINTVAQLSPNQINDLRPKSSSINVTNIEQGDGTPDPGEVIISNPIFSYSSGGFTASFGIECLRTVPNYTGANNVNAYNTCTITINHKTDSTDFNDVTPILVDDVKVRPIYFGQGSPFSAPAPPVSLNATYPAPSAPTFILFTAAFDGWISADLNYQVQWSLDNFVTIWPGGDNTGALVEIGPVGGAGTGQSYTMYARARVIDPYISPWSSATSVTYTDTRPP